MQPDAPHAWARFPGLRFGHMVGNRGRGRIQLAVQRAFIASPTDVLSTTQVFEFALVRVRRDRWRQRNRWSVVRALDQVADRVGRSRGPGRPWLWRVKATAADIRSALSD